MIDFDSLSPWLNPEHVKPLDVLQSEMAGDKFSGMLGTPRADLAASLIVRYLSANGNDWRGIFTTNDVQVNYAGPPLEFANAMAEFLGIIPLQTFGKTARPANTTSEFVERVDEFGFRVSDKFVTLATRGKLILDPQLVERQEIISAMKTRTYMSIGRVYREVKLGNLEAEWLVKENQLRLVYCDRRCLVTSNIFDEVQKNLRAACGNKKAGTSIKFDVDLQVRLGSLSQSGSTRSKTMRAGFETIVPPSKEMWSRETQTQLLSLFFLNWIESKTGA